MKKLLLLSVIAAGLTTVSRAQFSEFQGSGPSAFTLSSDNNTLQIAGRASFYYQNRFLYSGFDNKNHNGFAVKDLDLDFYGKTSNKFEYEMQLSAIDIVSAAATQNTSGPTNPGFKAAYIRYDGLPVKIKLGYDKLPYSQGSLNDVYGTPMWSHANLYGGDFFSRRDMGLTLSTRLWRQRISIYGGIYSGLGENIFEYGGDATGKPEFVGRVEFAYPAKMKYNAIDEESSSLFRFRVGLNARYTDKTYPADRTVAGDIPDAPGPYGIRFINGKKTVYGGDLIAMYKGLSLLVETDMIDMKPASSSDPLYYGTAESVNNGTVKAGGMSANLNYNFEKIHSVFSVMYEHINANDLAVGHEEWLYFAYAYKLNGFNSVFKAEYYRPLQDDPISNPLKYYGQIRVGYQIVF